MKIAIIGTRGIPARYGGFETFAENLGVRLVEKGHSVTVYCRAHYTPPRLSEYKGVKLIVLPTIKNKYLDTVINTFLSTLHVLFTDAEIVYFCNTINSVFTLIPRVVGKKTVINVDGLEWKRTKWNMLGKVAYRISERLAVILANAVVTDSLAIKNYYKKRFGVETVYIPYGAEIAAVTPSGRVMAQHNLRRREYILYVSRLEPENNAHVAIEAYGKVKTDMPLVIVGDAPYGRAYIRQLKTAADRRVKFLGGIYGDGYHELICNAFLYIHGNEVGGTNPALLEAMAAGNCVIVNGVDFNKEVIGDSGLWFDYNDPEDLKNKIEYILAHHAEAERYGHMAAERIKKYYNWEEVVAKTEILMRNLLNIK